MRAVVIGLAALWFAPCAPSSVEGERSQDPASRSKAEPTAVEAKTEAAVDPVGEVQTAYFAGGCFWGVEHYLEQMPGVLSVESGYMGGHVQNPTYEDVQREDSGHLETVRVRFDSGKIGYREVAKRFFEIHDPTQADGQGPDIGPEYRSAVFYADPEQERITHELIAKLRERGYDVVTEVREAKAFYPAEDYHQDYYDKTGKTPYCHARVKRFGE